MDPTELRRLAGRTGTALGILEKDQALTLVLGVLAQEPCARDLAFKGGTALSKTYFEGYRFSEALDFTAMRDVSDDVSDAAPRLLDAGRRAGVRLARVERVPGGKSGRTLKVRYEDMNLHPNHVLVQLSLREKVLLPAEPRPIYDPYRVVPRDARMPTMDLREIAAEKVRSLFMRSQARDLYDLWFLLREGVALDSDLVEAKLGWWKKGMAFRPDELGPRIDRIGATWRRDLEPLLGQVPPFEAVAGTMRSRLRKVRAGRA
ncbi:MAG TPA: nucleotidyl transferase AbiEii/AbiGii toxin family protein [Thermoplasmata archaeon]|nr:nucleotidyl transferase AbiEii/AbiGii toxin family protein [Thermoplasmata archaeon]